MKKILFLLLCIVILKSCTAFEMSTSTSDKRIKKIQIAISTAEITK